MRSCRSGRRRSCRRHIRRNLKTCISCNGSTYQQNDEKKKEIAKHIHNGSQGFGESIPLWILITFEQGAWGHLDTDQGYIDAGIFTMNLLYSLQYYGFAACTLNAKLDKTKQKSLQSLLGYPSSELPVVFIGVGMPEEQYMVARSRRLDVSEMTTVI